MSKKKSDRAPTKYLVQKKVDNAISGNDWTWIDIMSEQGPRAFDSITNAETYVDGSKWEGQFRIITVRKCFTVAKTEALAKTYE